MTIGDISYETEFVWHKRMYVQVIRPKIPKCKKYLIIVRLKRDPQSNWVSMPSSRKIKPVVRL